MEQLRVEELSMGLLRLVHKGGIPKGGAVEVEQLRVWLLKNGSLGWGAKGWSS